MLTLAPCLAAATAWLAPLPPNRRTNPVAAHRLAGRRQAFHASDVINVQGTDDDDLHFKLALKCLGSH